MGIMHGVSRTNEGATCAVSTPVCPIGPPCTRSSALIMINRTTLWLPPAAARRKPAGDGEGVIAHDGVDAQGEGLAEGFVIVDDPRKDSLATVVRFAHKGSGK